MASVQTILSWVKNNSITHNCTVKFINIQTLMISMSSQYMTSIFCKLVIFYFIFIVKCFENFIEYLGRKADLLERGGEKVALCMRRKDSNASKRAAIEIGESGHSVMYDTTHGTLQSVSSNFLRF